MYVRKQESEYSECPPTTHDACSRATLSSWVTALKGEGSKRFCFLFDSCTLILVRLLFLYVQSWAHVYTYILVLKIRSYIHLT